MPTTYNKVTAGGQTLIDLSQDTVTQASHIMAGYVGHLADGTQVEGTGSGGGGGTYQAKTNINPTTSSQTITPDNGYEALSSVQINAMPSGTTGTPTATKGTVSNHSVSVTPSVTNTTGYITGSTKTGTAVTVSASELVSGSETKTANGTYDVTNLAQLIVNVSGSSGLVYETGTYTPASDVARPTISFSNTHSTTPILIGMGDTSGASSSTNNSCTFFGYIDALKITGSSFPYSTSASRYGAAVFGYRTSSSGSVSTVTFQYGSNDTGDSTTAYARYWATESNFKPYANSTSRYWRRGRTYKWIAVWGPTT